MADYSNFFLDPYLQSLEKSETPTLEEDAQEITARKDKSSPCGKSFSMDEIEGLSEGEEKNTVPFGIYDPECNTFGHDIIIDHFQLDMTQPDWKDIVGFELDKEFAGKNQRRFSDFEFENNSQKEAVLKHLLKHAYKLACYQHPPGASNDNCKEKSNLRDLRRLQRTSISKALRDIDSLKDLEYFRKFLSLKVVRDLKENSHVTNTLVAAPLLGDRNFIDQTSLQQVKLRSIRCHFGFPGNDKPLRYFLFLVYHVLNGKFNTTVAYKVLLHVLTGIPKEFIEYQQLKRADFKKTWYAFQEIISSIGKSLDNIDNEIFLVLKTKPTNIHYAISKLEYLIRIKHSGITSKHVRLTAINDELLVKILAFLKIWYPSYRQPILDKFQGSRSLLQSKLYEQRYSAICLIQHLHATIQESPDLQQTVEIPKSEYHYSRSKPTSKQRLSECVPKHLKNKCYKCGGNHKMKFCMNYPNEKIGKIPCNFCSALHISPCISLDSKNFAREGKTVFISQNEKFYNF